MSLKLPYQKYPDPKAPAGFYYAASVPVNIALPAKNSPRSKRFDAIIDSGASSCIFHAAIGRAIGLEVEEGELTLTQGVAGPCKLYLHDISLYIPGGPVLTRAGFSDDLPIAGLVGMLGFFEHFRITFDPTALRVDLERLYHA
ncbi:MAG TPA: hypothetical protein VEK84_02525 [Terriglobales bacterium]|nr:hypothetical protein [Terriglobales bacterium]